MSLQRNFKAVSICGAVAVILVFGYYFTISRPTIFIVDDSRITHDISYEFPSDRERNIPLFSSTSSPVASTEPPNSQSNQPSFVSTTSSQVSVPPDGADADPPKSNDEDAYPVLLPEENREPPEVITSTEASEPTESPTLHLFDTDMVGYVNYDIWKWMIGFLVDDMRIQMDFPNNPDVRKSTNILRVAFSEKDPQDVRGKYAHKIYGYLRPSTAGDHSFSVEMWQLTAACSVELWMSTDNNPMNIHRVLFLEYKEIERTKAAANKKVDSGAIRMVGGGVYYFEFLEKAYDGSCTVEIKWKTPDGQSYVTIPSDNLIMAVKLDDGHFTDWPIVETLTGALPSNKLQNHHHVQFVGDTVYPITDFNVLPSCEFSPSYAFPRTVKTYTGIKLVFGSKVYPPDDTWHKHKFKPGIGNKKVEPAVSSHLKKGRGNKKLDGNIILEPATADKVLRLYKKAFNESRQYRGQVLKLRFLEETVDKKKGSRFLLEVDIKLDGQEEIAHTSEYVFLSLGADHLCHTENFQWRKNADVHIVVSLKNLGIWTKHLIQNMEDIYAQTHDDHFQLIIVDYHSEDLNVEEELRKSSLKRWKVIQHDGPFSRSGGLQAGIQDVSDPDSIVMTIDMHLTLPPGFVEYIRRHVVKGKMGYAPMFFRLRPGYTEINIDGFWETLTYGLFGMYKSDWDVFGGFDTNKYTTKWGGEDWDILDKALAKGYEVFRHRYPGLVHYHHTKAGMWGNKPKRR